MAKFVKGQSGNPAGRPKGSKNVITAQKLLIEETFRGNNADKIQKVLDLVVKQALSGDKASQKLIWDAAVSKANHSEDKASGAKQTITINRMDVNKEGDIIDIDAEDVKNVEDEQTAPAGSVPTH